MSTSAVTSSTPALAIAQSAKPAIQTVLEKKTNGIALNAREKWLLANHFVQTRVCRLPETGIVLFDRTKKGNASLGRVDVTQVYQPKKIISTVLIGEKPVYLYAPAYRPRNGEQLNSAYKGEYQGPLSFINGSEVVVKAREKNFIQIEETTDKGATAQWWVNLDDERMNNIHHSTVWDVPTRPHNFYRGDIVNS